MCELFTATTRETTDPLTSPRATSIPPIPTTRNKAAFQRPVFPRVSSAVRVIPYHRNRKNRCGSWACKCICGFPRYGGNYLAHKSQSAIAERPDGAIAEKPDGAIAERPDGAIAERPDGAIAERPDGAIASVHSSAAEIFAKPRTVRKASVVSRVISSRIIGQRCHCREARRCHCR
ncbi:hypothetical protein AVEN_227125-1, partial [Araneus ventricosus]